MIIIGAGVIGVELGSVWSRLGTQVNHPVVYIISMIPPPPPLKKFDFSSHRVSEVARSMGSRTARGDGEAKRRICF